MRQASEAKKSEKFQGHSRLCADGGLSLGQGLGEGDVAAVRQQCLLLHTQSASATQPGNAVPSE